MFKLILQSVHLKEGEIQNIVLVGVMQYTKIHIVVYLLESYVRCRIIHSVFILTVLEWNFKFDIVEGRENHLIVPHDGIQLIQYFLMEGMTETIRILRMRGEGEWRRRRNI